MLSQFNSVNARHLTEKPKIFFIQACRGGTIASKKISLFSDRYDHGILTRAQDETDGGHVFPDVFRFSPFACITKPSKPQEFRLPTETDFFIAYATVPDYVSWRNNLHGTWFIQAICEVFSRHAYDRDITEMMTLVIKRIAHGNSYLI